MCDSIELVPQCKGHGVVAKHFEFIYIPDSVNFIQDTSQCLLETVVFFVYADNLVRYVGNLEIEGRNLISLP